MGKEKPVTYSPKKQFSFINVIVLVQLIVLAVLVYFILSQRQKTVVETVDTSSPAPMIRITSQKSPAKTQARQKSEAAASTKKKAKRKKKVKKTKVVEAKLPPVQTAPKESAVKKKGYYLQVGAFADKANLEELKQQIDGYGYPIDIRTAKKKIDVIKVTLGRFSAKDDADEAAGEIRELGYKPDITELAKGKYEVSIGSILYRSVAQEIKEKLAKSGIKVRIKEEKKYNDLYILRVGAYDSKQEARAVQSELTGKGVKSYLFNK